MKKGDSSSTWEDSYFKNSRIKSNFELDQSDIDAIEGIAAKKGQKRYCNPDGMWGSSLFANGTLQKERYDDKNIDLLFCM